MDCNKVNLRMYRYLDGELVFWRRWAMARHLKGCSPCEKVFFFEVRVQQVVAQGCTCDETPLELQQRIIQALVSEGCPPPGN